MIVMIRTNIPDQEQKFKLDQIYWHVSNSKTFENFQNNENFYFKKERIIKREIKV